ncbi:MAG: hypothetical protein R6V35_03850 [Candidatus Nanohaloarchaea archaeon]
MKDLDLTKNQAFAAVISSAAVFGVISAHFASRLFFAPNQFFQSVILAKVFFTSFNIVMLGTLTYTYLSIYREVPTSMSRGFSMFSAALLLYAVTSSPVVHILSGFETISVGPFTYVPDMFVAIAASLIFYETQK